jgi:hypothetical protein
VVVDVAVSVGLKVVDMAVTVETIRVLVASMVVAQLVSVE